MVLAEGSFEEDSEERDDEEAPPGGSKAPPAGVAPGGRKPHRVPSP